MIVLHQNGAENRVVLESFTEHRIAYVGSSLTGEMALHHYMVEHGNIGTGLDIREFIGADFFRHGLAKSVEAFVAIASPMNTLTRKEELKLPCEFTVPVLLSFNAVARLIPFRAYIQNVSSKDARERLEKYWRSIGHGDN